VASGVFAAWWLVGPGDDMPRSPAEAIALANAVRHGHGCGGLTNRCRYRFERTLPASITVIVEPMGYSWTRHAWVPLLDAQQAHDYRASGAPMPDASSPE